MRSLFKLLRGVHWRVARQTKMIVLRATSIASDQAATDRVRLIRLRGAIHTDEREIVEKAMRAAGEPDGLVVPRFAHGDEFFGWLIEGEIVSFGWVTYRDRQVGSVHLSETLGRVFLFNFFTQEGYRGRSLYPALLLTIRSVLSCEKVSDFVIDVNSRNTPSARGIEKAGFVPVARIRYLTLFNRWNVCVERRMLDISRSPLF